MRKNLTSKYINSIVDEYSSNPKYICDKEITLIAVEKSPSLLNYACKELKDDEEVVLTAISGGGSALQFASKRLRGEKAVVLKAMSDFLGAYAFALSPAREDGEVVEAVAKSGGDIIELIPEEKKDDISLALLAIKRNPKAVRFFSKRVRSDETVVKEVLKADRTAIKYLPDEVFLNKRIYEAAKTAYRLTTNANALSNDVPLGFLAAMRNFKEKINLASQNFDLFNIERDKLLIILDIFSGVIVRRGELFRKYVDADDREVVGRFLELKLITPAAAKGEVTYAVKNSKRRVLPMLIDYAHKATLNRADRWKVKPSDFKSESVISSEDEYSAAKAILDIGVNSFSAEYSYFSYPLAALSPCISSETPSILTDGKGIEINPNFLLEWTADKRPISALFMHTLLHNILLHPFVAGGKDFDLVADISVGYIIDTDGLRYDADKLLFQRKAVYKSIIDKFNVFNESAIDRFLSSESEENKEIYRRLFKVCDHSKRKGGSVAASQKEEGDSETQLEFWRNISIGLLSSDKIVKEAFRTAVKAAVGGKYDYRNFLKKFLSIEEKLGQNEEEFDYIYYCLGLKNYGNMPLVENLEYRETKDFSDVVIAIDTSGSTKGEPVKRFAREVCTLVNQAFGGEKYRLRIIECDSEIREDFYVEGKTQFDREMTDFVLTGGGGTDFRPVFDRLYREKQNGRHIKGLIYFTDGHGIFPDKDYGIKTCFVLYGANTESVKTPYYAYRIELGGI